MRTSHRPYRVFAALVAGVISLAGCTASDEPDYFDTATGNSTTKSAAATESATVANTRGLDDGGEGGIKPGRTVIGARNEDLTTEELAVAKAYESFYLDCFPEAALQVDRAEDILHDCTTTAAKQVSVDDLRALDIRGVQLRGRAILGNAEVKFLDSRHAQVFACHDGRETGSFILKEKKWESRGALSSYRTDVELVDVVWKIGEIHEAPRKSSICSSKTT